MGAHLGKDPHSLLAASVHIGLSKGLLLKLLSAERGAKAGPTTPASVSIPHVTLGVLTSYRRIHDWRQKEKRTVSCKKVDDDTHASRVAATT